MSWLTLVLVRGWEPEDVEATLSTADAAGVVPGRVRAQLPQAGNRYCLDRVALAEIGDLRLNRRLEVGLQGARSLVSHGQAVMLRYGAGLWRTLVEDEHARPGGEVEAVNPSTGECHSREVGEVGLRWNGVAIISLLPSSYETASRSTHPVPLRSLHSRT